MKNRLQIILIVLFVIIGLASLFGCEQKPLPIGTPYPTNQQPIDIVSAKEVPTEPNPGGGLYEITLKNVSTEPVVSLSADLYVLPPAGANPRTFHFEVTPSKPLLQNKSISSRMILIAASPGNTITINGMLQDGGTFSYTREH